MDLPVTIVVKAPNQRVEDQTVDCMLGWTVKKLKQHLTDVYPNKPNETSQRLIYSGKLLADHLTLKEVLRQFDDDSNKHTVHLVCSSSPQGDSKSHSNDYVQSQSHSRQSSSSSNHSQYSIGSAPEVDGLRFRGHSRNASPSASQTSTQSSMPQTGSPYVFSPNFSPNSAMPQQMPAGFMPDPTVAAMMYGGNPAMGYTAEQYMWMQQMYAQYMAQYMQYYQQGGMYQTPPGSPQTPNTPVAPPQNAPAANDAMPAGEVQDDVMDDDEFGGQRDWLDYVYTLSRFMVLVGIVYFYSSIYRFLAVGGVFFLIYALHMGWFHRRQRQQQQQQNQQPREPAPQQQQQQQQQNEQADNSNEPDGAALSENQAQPTPPPEPAGPGFLQLTWTFVSTFITSLLPTPPPAVNAN